VGDAAIDQVLDAYAAVRPRPVDPRKRWSVEHFFIGPARPLSARQGARPRAPAQDHCIAQGPSLIRSGPRARRAGDAGASFLDQGILVAGGTDSPYSYNRLGDVSLQSRRETISDGVYGANQRITREEALRLFTITTRGSASRET